MVRWIFGIWLVVMGGAWIARQMGVNFSLWTFAAGAFSMFIVIAFLFGVIIEHETE